MRRAIAIALACGTLALAGAGCVLDRKIGFDLPWRAPAQDAGLAAAGIVLKPGLALTVRPSLLGVTGAIDEALGDQRQAVRVMLREADPGKRIALDWLGASASGSLELPSVASAQAMLLPAFWPKGRAVAEGNGGLWLSPSAYAALQQRGTTDWKLGVADNTLTALLKAFNLFNDLSSKLSASATTSAPISPFALRKTGTIDTFPLLVDGKLTLVRTIQATSWFADLVILDNPQNPLIVKVTIHPVAEPALKVLGSADIQWDSLGYEITSISSNP